MTKQLKAEIAKHWEYSQFLKRELSIERKRNEELLGRIKIRIVELEKKNLQLREVLQKIGRGPPNGGEPLDLLNKFVDLARAALKEKE